MSDSSRTPDASAGAQRRAGATEDYGGVPISEEELAQVWTTGEGEQSPGDHTGSDTGDGTAGDTGDGTADDPGDATVSAADPAEAGVTRPEVPADDPAPSEPS